MNQKTEKERGQKIIIRRDLSSESDGEYREEEYEESDPEWKEVKSWNRNDLMGNEKDRKRHYLAKERLFAMSELERELELAERRKKVL
jgi:hypothetical protein